MTSIATDYQRYKLLLSGTVFIWTLIVFLPGAYSIDSWNQWNEVSGGRYDDWYGTGFATTWRHLWQVTGNYMCLYVVQMLMYWLFFTALLWNVNFKSALYWLTMACALFFCFIPQYVMRDSLMVLTWALAALLLLHAGRNETYRRFLTLLSLLLIAYGLWIRVNMIAALFPMVYAAVVILDKRRIALWRVLLMTFALGIIMLLAYSFMTYKVQHANRTYPDYKLKLLDLTGISKLSGENWFPASIRKYPGFNLDTVLTKYSPAGIDDIYWPEDHKAIFPYPTDSIDGTATYKWHRAILHHPIYYLENRLTGFLYYLHILKRFKPNEYYNVAVFWIQPNGPLPAVMEQTPLKNNISRMYAFFFPSVLFDPWFWLLLNIAGFFIFVYRYRRNPDPQVLVHACIQLSGILFILSQSAVYQSDRDFRYTYWNIIVAFFALVGIFCRPASTPASPYRSAAA